MSPAELALFSNTTFAFYTYVAQILKKQSPVTEEEKLLLEVITSDSTTIAATLRKLLHCGEKQLNT